MKYMYIIISFPLPVQTKFYRSCDRGPVLIVMTVFCVCFFFESLHILNEWNVLIFCHQYFFGKLNGKWFEEKGETDDDVHVFHIFLNYFFMGKCKMCLYLFFVSFHYHYLIEMNNLFLQNCNKYLTLQSVPITNNVASSNPVHGEVYLIRHCDM
jgi:hypothetical protein